MPTTAPANLNDEQSKEQTVTAKKTYSQRLTAKIHIGVKELQIPNDDGDDATGQLSTYKKMLKQLTGKTSTLDMSDKEKSMVLNHLRNSGFVAKKKTRVATYPGTPHNIDRKPRLWKIEALLTDMSLPWSYADAIAKNITGGKGASQGGSGREDAPGVDCLAWVKNAADLDAIIAALHVEQQKRNLLARVDHLLNQLGRSRDDLPPLRTNWQRHRPTLRVIIEQLGDELTKREAASRAV